MTTGDLLRVTVNAAKTLIQREYEGGRIHWMFWCPACNELHIYNSRRHDGGPGWDFDGNMDAPTFSPSLRYLSGTRCHLFVRAGVIDFCGDCPHAMAGQRVPLPPIPADELECFGPP